MGLSMEQKREILQSVKYWYHTIDLGDGLVTPGWEAIRSMNQAMVDFLPLSLKGMSVLDIGCWDGLFSFEAEKRGASRVLGIDNLAGGDGFSQEQMDAIKGDGFKPLITAKTILGSNVECQVMNVYDISPEKTGEFDCTIFFGVLYHLWHPMLALQLIRRVTRKCLFIETHVNETIDQFQPLIRFYPRGEKYEGSTWVGLNLLALYEMLHLIGFKKVMLYRFRDHYERAIGMAFVDEKHFQEFQFKHDERFIPFDPGKPGKSADERLQQAEAQIEAQMALMREVESKYFAAGADRAARLEVIHELGQRLDSSEADHAASLQVIEQLAKQVQCQAGDIDRLRNSLELMKSSLSWRMTAPLRWLRRQWHHVSVKV